jgi:hypothetical protein
METCSFCRDQYDLALDFLSSDMETLHSINEAMEAGLREPRQAPYRLAAQTAGPAVPLYRLRRTWYLEDNTVILRVIEDTQRHSLTGFFIGNHADDQDIRIIFDGIEKEFIPDGNGVFEIGIATIDIEPMKVTLMRA